MDTLVRQRQIEGDPMNHVLVCFGVLYLELTWGTRAEEGHANVDGQLPKLPFGPARCAYSPSHQGPPFGRP